MSYLGVGPGWYRMTAPDTVLSAGGKDWSSAPWVDWGDNPNTAGGPRLAVGSDAKPIVGILDPKLVSAVQPPPKPITPVVVSVGLIAAAVGLFGLYVYMAKGSE